MAALVRTSRWFKSFCASAKGVIENYTLLGQRSLVGCSPWGRWGSDSTERLHFQFSLSCIGEGNGNPLQCSCLENPRDGGAWWAAVSGVAQCRTQLKRLSSSSSSSRIERNLRNSLFWYFYRCGNWGSERWGSLLEVTQLAALYFWTCFPPMRSISRTVWRASSQKWLN